VECESYAMLKRIIAQSDCISAALEQTLARELQERDFVTLAVEAPELSTRTGIIRLAERSPSPLASQLIACIAEQASAGTSRDV
jgi:DNA-binding transcriptional LysR family regulator